MTNTSGFRLKLFAIAVIICTILGFIQPLLASQPSNYSIHSQQSFNQPQYYPLTQTVNPKLYQPVGNWVGRLILPKTQEIKETNLNSDWVWFEVQHAPASTKNLRGKIIPLQWKNQSELKSYVNAVTKDVNFTPATFKSQKQGIVHPQRLNNRFQVKPLQSLAAARTKDDVIVTLDNPEVVETDNLSYLQISQEPILATGRFYALVDIIQLNNNQENSQDINQEFFKVRHFNSESNKFDGDEETIYIPQQVLDTRGIAPSTTNKLEESTATKGWYIYGAKNKQGIFTAQALAPHSLFQLQPDAIITETTTAQNYLEKYWQINPSDKGTLRKTLIDSTSTKSEYPVSQWREGDKAIILNVFGGIGGKKAEPLGVPKTITGHFAFGVAEIIRSPFTNKLEFDIKYHQ
ncbi:MAG: CPBP family intramembrane glutamate endopeptidase, partial [Cyanobacteria bacterium J06633_8]